MPPFDLLAYNREAWNRQVREGNEWTLPVSPEAIARARQDDWSVVLTPQKPVPRDWFPRLKGAKVLGPASGGGQLDAGFTLTGYFEDRWSPDKSPLSRLMPCFGATRAIKP